MPKFIEFSNMDKSTPIVINIDQIQRMTVINKNTRLTIKFMGFDVWFVFDKKNPKGYEMMKHIADGNTDISQFNEFIKNIQWSL